MLSRLGLPFQQMAPEVDEQPLPGEEPQATAARLASAKALAVTGRLAAHLHDALVIGSDQVATLDGVSPLGKPGDHQRAFGQLRAQSGRTVAFHTALTVVRAGDRHTWNELVTTEVSYKPLTDTQIERYLRAEQPYDCAGAARCEGLGIALLREIRSPDETALIGLPLIALCTILEEAGRGPLSG